MQGICSRFSRKTIFGILTTLCIMGILLVTFYTNVIKQTLTYWPMTNLSDQKPTVIFHLVEAKKSYRMPNKTLYGDIEHLFNESVNGNSFSTAVSTPSEKIQNITRKHFRVEKVKGGRPVTTRMTFNKSLVVACKETPFVECAPPIVKMEKGKVYKVSFIRQPKWHPKRALNVSICRYNQCQFQHDTVSNDTDLAVVYGVNLRDNFKPPQRWSHQLWAISMWESPLNTHAEFLQNRNSLWNSQFNLTMTYRVDSDIFSPYSQLKFSPIPLNKRPNYYEIAKRKTKTAVWLVSHCHTQSKRQEYVREMQKYVDVDIYGGCGEPCPKQGAVCDDLPNIYKFYLSFENSMCNDYMTEKFYKFYSQGLHIIPVVRGGSNYNKYMANYTFINAADFNNAKELALFLKDLSADLETYSRYLEYKDLYVNLVDCIDIACRICEYLHTHPVVEPKIYNMDKWTTDKQCFSPSDY